MTWTLTTDGQQGDFLNVIHRAGSKSSFFHWDPELEESYSCLGRVWKLLWCNTDYLYFSQTLQFASQEFSLVQGWILSIWNPWPFFFFFFFFFLKLDRLPIIFQNRAWKLPHFWNLPEPKGRAHSEATLVFIFYHLELRSCLIKLCKSMSFYILFSFNPACKWTNFFLSSYFFFHENILNETYNKWCRLLVFCFPTSSLWVIFVLWSSF